MDPVLSIALLSGALATDNRSSLRLLVSQPVCGGLLVGFVLGNPGDGLLAGAILQMLFLGVVPVRGLGMIDLPLGGVTVSSLYILVPRSAAVDPAARGLVLLLALAASLGVAWAGGALYRLWEGRSHGIADAALRLSGKGHFGLAAALHFSTVGVHFAFGFAVAAAVVLGGASAVARIAAAAWGPWAEPLGALPVLLPFVGAGSLVALNFGKVRGFLFLAGFCTVLLVRFFGG
jgi:PTS system N-acetylgalactosamine-specific IIC component